MGSRNVIPSWLQSWDRYEALSVLGAGGMGTVYKARDRRLGRVVALKFIRGGDERPTERFLQEARAQSRADHPGICKVLEVAGGWVGQHRRHRAFLGRNVRPGLDETAVLISRLSRRLPIVASIRAGILFPLS